MQNKDEKQKWEEYCKSELAVVSPMLSELGFELEKEQPHISGERYLMSGRKLVLMGVRKSDGKRVVVKVSNDLDGKKEIKEEHERRDALNKLKFSYHKFLLPEEILFKEVGGFLFSVVLYIEQGESFMSLDLKDQFFIALGAFKIQEGVHATAHSHTKTISKIFGVTDDEYYIDKFSSFVKSCKDNYPDNAVLHKVLEDAEKFLISNKETVDRYSGFLTHTDFVPHNFRIVGDDLYLLDYSSMHFGNKYESWARFLNYMTIYNRDLELLLDEYVHKNRSEGEYLSFRLMRVYKLGFLLQYYASTLSKTSGSLNTLNKKRIAFWSGVLRSIIDGNAVSEDLVDDYKISRDSLRSEEERQRQEELQQV